MHDLQDGRSTVTYQVSRFYNILWILKFYSFVPGICLIQVLRCDGHHLHQASNINLNLCYWKKGSWTHGCIWLLLSVRLSSGCQVCNQSEKKRLFSSSCDFVRRDDSELVPDSKYKVLFSGRTKGEIYCTEVWSQIMRSLSLRAEFQWFWFWIKPVGFIILFILNKACPMLFIIQPGQISCNPVLTMTAFIIECFQYFDSHKPKGSLFMNK